MILGLDIETCSAASISNGSDPYAAHPSTRVHVAVLKLADRSGVHKRFVWTPNAEDHDWLDLPAWVIDHIEAGLPVLAHNASFEASILKHILVPHFGWPAVKASQWLDTLAVAASMALPLSLADLARAIGAKEKDEEGADLMKSIAVVKVDPATGAFVYPVVTYSQLVRLTAYCERDVDAMFDCWWKLPPMHPTEQEVLIADRRINQTGAFLDEPLAAAMHELAVKREAQIGEEMLRLTGDLFDVEVNGLKRWLTEKGIKLPKVRRKNGETSESLDKKALAAIMARDDLPEEVATVLKARGEAGRLTSLAKVKRVPEMVSADGRLRYALRFAGAHTGRWSSKGLQVHNLAKPSKEFRKVSEPFLAAVRRKDVEGAARIWPLLEGMSFSLRSVVAAAPGHEIIGGDYAAIEARGVAWLAGQDDVLAALADPKRDLYVEDAAKIGSTDRQLGKTARLGLGYGMGAVKFYDKAIENGVDLTRKQARVSQMSWRANNPKIVNYWKVLERAFRFAIEHPGGDTFAPIWNTVNEGVPLPVGALKIVGSKEAVRVRLPSGRLLHYWRPSVRQVLRKIETIDPAGNLVTNEYETDEIRFYTAGKTGMQLETTYGGALTENVTQAVCRDLLAAALLRLELSIYRVVLHVHDSIAAEVLAGTGDVDEFCAIMAETPQWAEGFPVAVEGYRSGHFKG